MTTSPTMLFHKVTARWQQRRTDARLRRRLPQLDRPLPDEIEVELAREHEFYVANVSSPKMAASLETARLLWQTCEDIRPQRLLDTGSGFSSFVLRRWARDVDTAAVWSVDDDAAWLERTRKFLNSRQLDDERLVHWNQFNAAGHDQFDLVFHDMGNMDTRLQSLPRILASTRSETGVVILDDMHKPSYRAAAMTELQRWRASSFDARTWTHDRFNRHAVIACNLTPSTARAAA